MLCVASSGHLIDSKNQVLLLNVVGFGEIRPMELLSMYFVWAWTALQVDCNRMQNKPKTSSTLAHAHSILTTQYTQTHAYGVQQTLWYVCMCDIFNVPSEYRNDSANGLCKSQKGWKNFSWAHKNCNAYIATPSEVTLGSVAKLFSNAAPPHSHFVHIPMYDCCFRLSDQIVSVCMCNVSLLEVNTQTIFQPVIWVKATLDRKELALHWW